MDLQETCNDCDGGGDNSDGGGNDTEHLDQHDNDHDDLDLTRYYDGFAQNMQCL